jgi:response regulator RpfG family c-di-GMP phosphodiesterase
LIIRLTDEKSQKNKIESLNQSLRDSTREKSELQKHATGLESGLLTVLNSLAMERDNETGNHIIRTQNYVKLLAQRHLTLGQLEASPEFVEVIYRAAPLHDIGKIGIPDSILLKPGKLTEDEWAVMKTHASIGENVLSTANQEHQIDSLLIKVATEIAGGHHENWNGSGYPKALAGNAIPQSARIMAVADTYDALVSKRVYKNEWTHEEAVQEVIKQRGIKFDPVVIDAFLLEAAQFNAIAQRYKD